MSNYSNLRSNWNDRNECEENQVTSALATKRNIFNSEDYLFGPYGEWDEEFTILHVDIRQVERVSGTGKLSIFKLINMQFPQDKVRKNEKNTLRIHICEGKLDCFWIDAVNYRKGDLFTIDEMAYKNCYAYFQISFWIEDISKHFFKTENVLQTHQFFHKYDKTIEEEVFIKLFAATFYRDLSPFSEILTELLGENPIDLRWWTEDGRKI